MKSRNKKFFVAVAFAFLMFSFLAYTKCSKAVDPGVGNYTISVPAALETLIVKETADNAVYYKFKKSDGTMQFLFSIGKVPFAQWGSIRSQIPDAKQIGVKDGQVYYAEITNRKSMKGVDKDAYAQIVSQLDAIVNSIKL